MEQQRTSPHILNTSANLLGFCLFVITALHVTDKTALTHIDEVASVVALALGLSSMLSFFSIRSKNKKTSARLESIADRLFIVSLAGITLVVLFIMLNII